MPRDDEYFGRFPRPPLNALDPMEYVPARIATPDLVMGDINRKLGLALAKIQSVGEEVLGVPRDILNEVKASADVFLPRPK